MNVPREKHEDEDEHEDMKMKTSQMNEERGERWVDSKFEKEQSSVPTHVRTVSAHRPCVNV
jgi:hypothetical protein